MKGLIKDTEEKMESCSAGAMYDAGVTSAPQKAEHSESTSYGTLHQFADVLVFMNAETLLEVTLKEEKAAYGEIPESAQSINIVAAEEGRQL